MHPQEEQFDINTHTQTQTNYQEATNRCNEISSLSILLSSETTAKRTGLEKLVGLNQIQTKVTETGANLLIIFYSYR